MTDNWEQHAACRDADPELFFPPAGGSDQAEPGKRVCAGCPVAAQCLDLAQSEVIYHGIFGGLTVDERKALRRRTA